jgi:aminopeptidase-like protein
MISLAKKLFPICRSITGDGNRKTLKILKKEVPEIKIKEVKSGTKVFDWKVPNEWNVIDAYIKAKKKKIIDFKKNNLHLVGYSIPFKGWLSKENLLKKIYTLPNQKNAIPYVTSYYKKNWGFCVAYDDLQKKFKSKKYFVNINTSLEKGYLTYAECVIKGKVKKEIFISCNICHPSMANNELSGMIVAINFIKWLKKRKKNFYTYRIIFIPETIGSITYLSKNFKHLKKNILAGLVLTCMGDNKNYSYIESRQKNSLTDRVINNYLKYEIKKYKKYSYLERGSDERQYCSPGIDLPVCCIMRSKFNTYKEYHTSLDNLNFISQDGLESSLEYVKNLCLIIENNSIYSATYKCEPNLGSRGLYPLLSSKKNSPLSNSTQSNFINYLNFLSYADGKNDLISIADKLEISALKLIDVAKVLLDQKLIKSR